MTMSLSLKCLVGVAILSGACALGQEAAPGTQPARVPVRPHTGEAVGPVAASRGESMAQTMKGVATELDLNPDQQAAFDKLMSSYAQKFAVQDSQDEITRALMRKMREARQSGNEQAIQEVRQELMNLHPSSIMERFFGELEPALDETQLEQLGAIREQLISERGFSDDPLVRLRGLKDRLKLDEKTAPRYDEEFKTLESDLKSADGGPATGELLRQLRAARAEGDEARVRALRQQLAQARARSNEAVAAFLGRITPLLNDDQKQIVGRYAAQVRGGESQPGDPRTILRLVRRLDLSREQRQQMRPIERETMQALRRARRDAQAMSDLRASVLSQVRGVLTPEQNAELDRLLAQTGKRPKREGKGRP